MNEDTEQGTGAAMEVWIAGTKLDGGGYQVKVDGFYSGRNTDEGADTIAQPDTKEGSDTGKVLGQNGHLVGGTSGENGAPNGGTDGVVALSPTGKTRDERGRLLPGTVLNPHGGRPAKDKALLIALNEHYPPETVVNMVQEAWSSAASRDSWRGMLEVARFLTEYIVGKPVARSITVSSKAGDMLARLEAIQLGGNDAEEQ